MPVHDWTRVEAAVFHDFHLAYIDEIRRALNHGLLPSGYFAMAEQYASGFGPDVLSLRHAAEAESPAQAASTGGGRLLLEPRHVELTAEAEHDFYRKKQNHVTVRHVTGHEVVAVIEVVSRGNKSSKAAMQAFVTKAAEFLEQGVHFLAIDFYPPGPRDPEGIHGLIWETICGERYDSPPARPLTLASYAADLSIRAYVKHLAVGESVTDMPLFIEPRGHVELPLESLYQRAVSALHPMFIEVLEGKSE